MSEPDPLGEALVSFLENSKDNPPDVKALARLFRLASERSDVVFHAGHCFLLVEILDSQLPERLACNWQLRPHFIGWYDEEACRIEKENAINEAIAATPNITDAISAVDDRGIPGMKGRTAWKIWDKMKRRRMWWNKVLDVSPLDDGVKASIRKAWRP